MPGDFVFNPVELHQAAAGLFGYQITIRQQMEAHRDEKLAKEETHRKEQITNEAHQGMSSDHQYKAYIEARVATQKALESKDEAKIAKASAEEERLKKAVDELTAGKKAMLERTDSKLQHITNQRLSTQNTFQVVQSLAGEDKGHKAKQSNQETQHAQAA